MKERLKKLINACEFDAALELMKQQISPENEKNVLILKAERNWESFKKGLSMKFYVMEQIDERLQTDFYALLEQLEIEADEVSLTSAPDKYTSEYSTYEETGTDSPTLEYVGFWKRVAIRVIDSIIGLLLFPVDLALIKYSFNNHVIYPILITSFIFICLQIFLVVRFGGTIGKLLLNVRIVDDEGRYLDLARAIVRDSPYLLISALSFLAYALTIDSLPENIQVSSLREISILLAIHAGSILIIGRFLNLFALFDVLTVAFNEKKRAIHDFMAGSFVVTRDSIQNINN